MPKHPMESARTHDSELETSERYSLRGQLTTRQLVLTVLGYLAPLGGAAGYVTLVIGYGNGLGAPLTYLTAGALFLIFSIGFGSIVQHVKNPGAFYAYISAGLGKRLGLSTALLTIAFYILGAIAFFPFGGILIADVVENLFHGPSLPWWLYVLVLMALVGFVCYRGIKISARVLGIIVAIEVGLVLLFNVVTLVIGGPTGRPIEPFTWEAYTSGSLAVGILFAFVLYMGFETTAIYREEVRDPARTIRRATMIVVVIISVFYAFTAWAIIASLGTDSAVDAAAADPAGVFPAAYAATLGNVFGDIVKVMIVTSVLASEIAILNATSRYVHSLSKDGVLPRTLARVHPRFHSPTPAILATLVVCLILIAASAFSQMPPEVIYSSFGGVGMFAFQYIVILVSLSVIVFFRRNRGLGESVWRTLIAPAVSVVAFACVMAYSIFQFDLIIGERNTTINVLLLVLIALPVGGFIYASYLAARRPDIFQRIGRALD